ncbi:hypothetical protein EV356DRAFT_504822 [Viridothelium virens]|uniref:Uncharacterized protein n=1 Tax=Viridothelium virens TaxID=1048519 RepID=A0A6A6H541_VIRVR|nr:hypothetical protein EV356DRAFT_504822 [Viridothelium virens]
MTRKREALRLRINAVLWHALTWFHTTSCSTHVPCKSVNAQTCSLAKTYAGSEAFVAGFRDSSCEDTMKHIENRRDLETPTQPFVRRPPGIRECFIKIRNTSGLCIDCHDHAECCNTKCRVKRL